MATLPPHTIQNRQPAPIFRDCGVLMSYDGLGRLIRPRRYDRLGNAQTETYYYDGARRIKEICLTTPADPNDPPTTAMREYVWGPDYVDEVVCQVDEGGTGVPPVRYTYYLQDANYNLTGVVADSGTVATQYQYTPYGQRAGSGRCLGSNLPFASNR